MLKIIAESHMDHGLTQAHIDFILAHFKDRTEFFQETVTMPDDLPDLECGLYGPKMGDEPVPESEVYYAKRGERTWDSRMTSKPKRKTRLLTVMAGPYQGDFVLYTAYGGPAGNQEPGDPNIREENILAAQEWWSQHALSDAA